MTESIPELRADLAAHADELADRCERRVPRTPGHPAAVAALRRATSEVQRTTAVASARADGMSWRAIALVLDISTDACRRRYAPPPHDPLAVLAPEDAA